MKTKILIVILSLFILKTNAISAKKRNANVKFAGSSISIKLKNDGDEAITVINAGSDGTYRLSKNTVVTKKMDEGDKLFVYENGKKGVLLLVASADMDNKVQLLSKI